MNQKEKATYLVYHRGRDPKKFRLGNLVVFPQNPEDSDPYIFPHSPSDLEKWTGEPQQDDSLRIEISDSQHAQTSANISSAANAGVGQGKGSNVTIQGENGRRFQIDQAIEFLNKEILSRPEAREWLNTRITVARRVYYMNRLKATNGRHPEIWMVTGIQLLSNVTVQSEAHSQSNINAGLQLPPPEIAAGITGILADDGFLGASIERSNDKGNSVGYQHVEERVWAAQFRRLKLNFQKEGQANLTANKKVSVYDLLDIGKLGIKGSIGPQNDEAAMISGVHDDEPEELAKSMRSGEGPKNNTLEKKARKRALLIGGSEHELQGVRNDIQAMSELLITRGFIVDFCFGEESTRDGILSTWARFIQGTGTDDTVVIYYSGHGGAIERDSFGQPNRIQYILPSDVLQTTESDFRGILDVELSHLITAMTDRTHNVTVILDCCHPERMARKSERGLRSKNVLSSEIIYKHMEELRVAGVTRDPRYGDGNPYSVRVVAAGSDKPAYEGSHGGKDMGHLTALLVETINEAGDTKTSWDAVLDEIRQRMPHWKPEQRPQVEGPRMRALFSLEKVDYWGRLSLEVQGHNVKLLGGLLAEVRVGDEYAIMPPRSITMDPKMLIARATVLTVDAGASIVRIEYEQEHNAVPSGSKAFPIRRSRPGYGVKVLGGGEKLESLLKRRLESARFVHQYSADKDSLTPFALIKHDKNEIILCRPNSPPTFQYALPEESEHERIINSAIHQIDNLGRADQLLHLVPEPRHALDMSSISVECGTVEWEQPVPFPDMADISIQEKERVYLKILNHGQSKLYASVFLITAIGTIEWMSKWCPSGAELFEQGMQAYIPLENPNYRDGDPIEGIAFDWPSGIPRNEPINEAFLVIVTNQKIDLGFLGTDYYTEEQRRELPAGVFNRLNKWSEPLKFGVKRIDYRLEP